MKQANPCACAGAAPEASHTSGKSFVDTKIQHWVVGPLYLHEELIKSQVNLL